MAIATVKQAVQAALSATTTTTLYTVPALTTFLVNSAVFCNTDSSARTVTMQWGGGTAAANRWLSAMSIIPGETKIITFEKPVVLTAGQTITGGASSANVVSCTISGVEVA
jgi:hypothetical protein